MSVDWHALFVFSVPPLELVIRGSAIYWFLLVLFRVVLRRDVGAIGVADVLLLVLVADAAQNAMAGEYRSISDGLVLVSTIVGWNVLVDWLVYRFAAVRRLLEAPALILVRDGRILHRNLRREFLTVEELRGKLREHGVDDIDQVRAAYMESDGEVSVITRRGEPEAPQRRARRAAGG
jgi:uncharacterized membrane protein YcaP (DUF421 family)